LCIVSKQLRLVVSFVSRVVKNDIKVLIIVIVIVKNCNEYNMMTVQIFSKAKTLTKPKHCKK